MRLIRSLDTPPPRTARALLAGLFVCGRALPWVRPKRHDWAQQARTDPWSTTVLVCSRCTRRMEF